MTGDDRNFIDVGGLSGDSITMTVEDIIDRLEESDQKGAADVYRSLGLPAGTMLKLTPDDMLQLGNAGSKA